MMQQREGRFFFQRRLIGRRHGNPVFFYRILKQFPFGNIREVEQFVEAVDESNWKISGFRCEQEPFFGETNLARLNTIGCEPLG